MQEFIEMYERNVETVYRLCYTYLKNAADAEDATQSVFLRFLIKNIAFHDLAHEKAWFILISKNYCKDILKSCWKKLRVDMENLPQLPTWDDYRENEFFELLMNLPEKYKTVIYLYYYEEYSVREISKILQRKESTIQTQLSKGRELLKINLGGDYHG